MAREEPSVCICGHLSSLHYKNDHVHGGKCIGDGCGCLQHTPLNESKRAEGIIETYREKTAEQVRQYLNPTGNNLNPTLNHVESINLNAVEIGAGLLFKTDKTWWSMRRASENSWVVSPNQHYPKGTTWKFPHLNSLLTCGADFSFPVNGTALTEKVVGFQKVGKDEFDAP